MTATGHHGTADQGRATGIGPFRAVHRMTDVEVEAMNAASEVIGRVLEHVDDPPPTVPEPAHGSAAEPLRALAQLRGDLTRALDLYADLVIRSFESYADLVERTVRNRGVGLATDQPAQPAPLVVRGPAGGQADGTVWVHNTTDRSVATSLRVTDLSAHDGRVVAGSAGVFRPATVSELAPGATASAALVVALVDVPPGVYRGHVLATGLPEASLPVELVVTDGAR